MNIPIIATAFITVLIIGIPLCNIISGLFQPQYGAYALSDITGGFILSIFTGFLGMPFLSLLSIIQASRISEIIRAEIE